jgi:peroxiredoxin
VLAHGPAIISFYRGAGALFATSNYVRCSYNGVEAAEVPLPATYVIDRSGIVRFAFVSADFTRRADPDNVIEAIQRVAGRASR